MVCERLMRGLDLVCGEIKNRYYQEVKLINRADLRNFRITADDSHHRVQFNLKTGAEVYSFRSSELVQLISASFSKSGEQGFPEYEHKVTIPVSGVTEDRKILLRELDLADYFAVIRFIDDTIEVYGFQYGLKTSSYSYQPQSSLAGAQIDLVGRYSEYLPPLNYYRKPPGDPLEDWEDDFKNVPNFLLGDFNNDYSDDFYNIT